MLKFITITQINGKTQQVDINNHNIINIKNGDVIFINEQTDYFDIKILNENDLLLTFEGNKEIVLENIVELFKSGDIVDSLSAKLHFSNYDILNFIDLIELLEDTSIGNQLENVTYFETFETEEKEVDINKILKNKEFVNKRYENESIDFDDTSTSYTPEAIEPEPIEPEPIEPEPIEDKEAQAPELSLSIDKKIVLNPMSWDGIKDFDETIIDNPTLEFKNNSNKNINCKNQATDDKIIIGNNANGKIELGHGDNILDIGNDSNKKITAGSGDDIIRIGNNANGKIEMGDGNNSLEIGNDANKKISAGDGNDSVKIEGCLNAKIELGTGDDSLHIAGDTNENIDMDSGDDKVKIEGNSNSSINLGEGDDFLEINGDVNGKINSGEGDDFIIIHGDVNSPIDLGEGSDHVIVDGKINAPINAVGGDDCIELNEYTYEDYMNNVDGIQDSLVDFEAIKFSDGTVIGDETLFEDDNTTYEYDLNISAKVTDIDSEHISSIRIDASSLTAGVMLLDTNGNEIPLVDGYYDIPLDDNTKESNKTITIISDEPISNEELEKIEVIATSKEDNGGDEKDIVENPILNDTDTQQDSQDKEKLNNEEDIIIEESTKLDDNSFEFALDDESIFIDIDLLKPKVENDLKEISIELEDILVFDEEYSFDINAIVSKYQDTQEVNAYNNHNENDRKDYQDNSDSSYENMYSSISVNVDDFTAQEDNLYL